MILGGRRTLNNAYSPTLSRGEYVQQRLRLSEVHGIKSFGEPSVDLGEHGTRLITATLWGEQPRQTQGRVQLQRFCARTLRERNGLTEVGLSQFRRTPLEPQFAAYSEHLGSVSDGALSYANAAWAWFTERDEIVAVLAAKRSDADRKVARGAYHWRSALILVLSPRRWPL